MSAAAFLEKLLGGTEVAWVPLGDDNFFEIANTARRPVKASLRLSGSIPYYGANNIQDYVKGHTHDGEYVLIAEDGSTSLENYSIQHVRGKFWANNHVHVVRGGNCVDTRFLYHYLTTANFLPFLSSKGRAKLTKANLVQVAVPIPCPDDPQKSLAIQGEIVRILDSFTELTAELTAELTQRKKQYNHYRDQLLTFDKDEVEWKTIGEVFDMRAGKHIKAKDIQSEPDDQHQVRCYGGNGIRGYVQEKSHDGDHLLIGRQGAWCGNVQREKGQFYATEHAVVVTTDKSIDVDWAFHMLSFMNLNQYASTSGISGLAVGNIKKLAIPVPPLHEQVRVSAILDKFDTLTTSISEGLPREIALREKQYAWYRDQLLSFPKPDVESA